MHLHFILTASLSYQISSLLGNLGLGAEANIITDCMNLIDFYTENEIAEQKQIGMKTIEKKVMEDDKEKTVTQEVPDYETVYPITGHGTMLSKKNLQIFCMVNLL